MGGRVSNSKVGSEREEGEIRKYPARPGPDNRKRDIFGTLGYIGLDKRKCGILTY